VWEPSYSTQIPYYESEAKAEKGKPALGAVIVSATSAVRVSGKQIDIMNADRIWQLWADNSEEAIMWAAALERAVSSVVGLTEETRVTAREMAAGRALGLVDAKLRRKTEKAMGKAKAKQTTTPTGTETETETGTEIGTGTGAGVGAEERGECNAVAMGMAKEEGVSAAADEEDDNDDEEKGDDKTDDETDEDDVLPPMSPPPTAATPTSPAAMFICPPPPTQRPPDAEEVEAPGVQAGFASVYDRDSIVAAECEARTDTVVSGGSGSEASGGSNGDVDGGGGGEDGDSSDEELPPDPVTHP
jgi:hypothetical protein